MWIGAVLKPQSGDDRLQAPGEGLAGDCDCVIPSPRIPGWSPADWSSVRIPRNAPWSGEEGDAYRTADFQGSFCGLRSDCWVSAGTRQMTGVPGHQDTRAFSSTCDRPSLARSWLFWRLPRVTSTLWTKSQSEVGKTWSQIRTSVTFALVALQQPLRRTWVSSVSPTRGAASRGCGRDGDRVETKRPRVHQRARLQSPSNNNSIEIWVLENLGFWRVGVCETTATCEGEEWGRAWWSPPGA